MSSERKFMAASKRPGAAAKTAALLAAVVADPRRSAVATFRMFASACSAQRR